MKPFFNFLIVINLLIALVGILGLSITNKTIFHLIYEDSTENVFDKYVQIGNTKIIIAIIIIWGLGILLGFKTNPKKQIIFYILTIFHCLMWTLILPFSNLGAGILS
jgi:hypothetical protein